MRKKSDIIVDQRILKPGFQQTETVNDVLPKRPSRILTGSFLDVILDRAGKISEGVTLFCWRIALMPFAIEQIDDQPHPIHLPCLVRDHGPQLRIVERVLHRLPFERMLYLLGLPSCKVRPLQQQRLNKLGIGQRDFT